MMNKRIIGLLSTLIMCLSIEAQGLRTSVCVVYPEFEPEDSTIMADFAHQLAHVGFTSDAQILNAYTGSVSGSGVLTEQYVLTNRHVVSYAHTARLVFELRDTTLTYEHCRVVSSSMDADVAAIEIPQGAKDELNALPISSEAAQDGEDIYAAGFPGLLGNPSWQLTRGTVSNAALRLDEGTFIQHTAPIDPGSSGGPLLRKRDGKFEILGLNTLKAFNRDRVGMSIQAEQLVTFMAAEPNTKDQSVLEQMRDVDSELWTTYYQMLPDSMKQVLHDMDIRLPMDRVMAVADYYGGPSQLQHKPQDKKRLQAKQTDQRLEQNSAGICELNDSWSFVVGYDYYNEKRSDSTSIAFHALSLNIEYARKYCIFGLNLGVPFNMNNIVQFYTGVRFGVQVPVRLKVYNILIPKATVDIQYLATMRPSFGGGCFRLPFRVGMDYRYELSRCSLIFGIGYTLLPSLEEKPIPLYHALTLRAGVAI